jgi:hypothetical protein
MTVPSAVMMLLNVFTLSHYTWDLKLSLPLIAIIVFIPITCSGIARKALGMDLTGGPIYPRKEGICLMMISIPIAINMPSTTEMGKKQREAPGIEDTQDHLDDPDDANGHQQDRIAFFQIAIPQRRHAGQQSRR